jgi:8-oxo-dGTP diphosphatase
MAIPGEPVHVSAGLIVRAGCVLACQRRADQTHPGKWEFPGGKREAGETMAECLRRELREELGIEAEIGAEVSRAEHTYPGRPPVVLAFFRVDAFAGEPRNLVFADVRWVAVAELGLLDFLDADRALIARLPVLLEEATVLPAPPDSC